MVSETKIKTDTRVYYNLVALWVVCEAFAGGIMHGFKIPFSGLIVSSLAVTCIVLIAWHSTSKTAIIRATVIVAIFKLMLSPHSPPTAYIAVFFQGLMGQLFLSKKRFFKISAIAVAVLSLVESATQRILVLIIIYGNGFWKALNQYIDKVTGQKSVTNYSLLLAGIYIFIHAVIGVVVGIYVANLARRSESWLLKYPEYLIDIKIESLIEPKKKKRSKKIKFVFIVIWIILLAFFVEAYVNPAHAFISPDEITGLLLRSILIILGWYLVFGPLIMKMIKRILLKQRDKNTVEINQVMTLLPSTKYIFRTAWQLSGKETGFQRLRLFIKILLINTLSVGK